MKKYADKPYENFIMYKVYHKKLGRFMACLYDPVTKCRRTVSYARYLMTVALGRELTSYEVVDHADNNKMNDTITNLVIMTRAENTAKENARKGLLVAEIKCPVCTCVFTKRKGLTQAVKCNTGRITCCSKACSDEHKKIMLDDCQRFLISSSSLLRVFREVL